MKRIKSIDTFRGLCMMWLISAHIIPQWLTAINFPVYALLWSLCDSVGACAFLFLSGISSMISYKKREQQANEGLISRKRSRNEYLIRASIIFLMGFIVNITLALVSKKWWWIIGWDFLQTISVSLFLAWPLFKTSKSFRIIFSIFVWIINEIILFFIRPGIGEEPILLFYLLYTTQSLDSVLWFFTFFLVGTVFGEIIYESMKRKQKQDRKNFLKNNLLIPSLIISIILIIMGILLEFPDLTSSDEWAAIRTLPWRIYALGIDMLLITLLLILEEYEIFKFKKNFRFLFYFSYYSFTVYASHYILPLLFIDRFNADILFWSILFITILLYGLLLNILYKTLGPKVSIKFQISRLSSFLAGVIEGRKKKE